MKRWTSNACGTGARRGCAVRRSRNGGACLTSFREMSEAKSIVTLSGEHWSGISNDNAHERPPCAALKQALCVAQPEAGRCFRTLDALAPGPGSDGSPQRADPKVDHAR